MNHQLVHTILSSLDEFIQQTDALHLEETRNPDKDAVRTTSTGIEYSIHMWRYAEILHALQQCRNRISFVSKSEFPR